MASSSMTEGGGAGCGSGGAFNPLHLFECTITNAGMLVEGMAALELLTALRILTGLHSRIVEIMEPTLGAVCHLADLHRTRCSPSGQESGSTAAATSKLLVVALDTKPLSLSSAVKAPPLDEYALDESAAAAAAAAAVVDDGGDGEEDEDCVMILEEEADDPDARGSQAVSSLLLPAAAAADDVGSREVTDAKSALSQCYKEMKGSGTHLFDFTKPFQDPVNAKVANSVISYAQAKTGNMGMSMSQWREVCAAVMQFYRVHRRNNRKWARWKSKLARRHKALECVLPELSPEDMEQHRVVLSREFTTSDEESEDEYGRVSLRSRDLPWQSDRVREIKQRLDDVFLRRFATRKQRAELAARQLDRVTRSARQPPEFAPAWSLKPEYGGARVS